MKRSLKLAALIAGCLVVGSVATALATGGTSTSPYTMCVAKNGTVSRPSGSTCGPGQTRISVANGDDVAALATRVNGAEGNIAALQSAVSAAQVAQSSQASAIGALQSDNASLQAANEALANVVHALPRITVSAHACCGGYTVNYVAANLKPGTGLVAHSSFGGSTLTLGAGTVAGDGGFTGAIQTPCDTTDFYVTGTDVDGNPVTSNSIANGCP